MYFVRSFGLFVRFFVFLFVFKAINRPNFFDVLSWSNFQIGRIFRMMKKKKNYEKHRNGLQAWNFVEVNFRWQLTKKNRIHTRISWILFHNFYFLLSYSWWIHKCASADGGRTERWEQEKKRKKKIEIHSIIYVDLFPDSNHTEFDLLWETRANGGQITEATMRSIPKDKLTYIDFYQIMSKQRKWFVCI